MGKRRRNRSGARLSAILLCLALLLGQSALAAGSVLTVEYPVEGATFSVYQVATRQSDGSWAATEAFSSYAVDLSAGISRELAATLESLVLRDGIEPDATAEVENGYAAFLELEAGLYLVVGEQTVISGICYTPVACLTELDGASGTYLEPKYDVDSEPTPSDTVTYTVEKVWSGDDADSRPESVTIQLLHNGTVYDEVELSEANNWTYTWRNLEATGRWTVAEKDVPDGYTVSIQLDSGVFTVTNTAQTPEEPEEPTPSTTPTTPDEPTPSESTTPEEPVTPSETTPETPDVTPEETTPTPSETTPTTQPDTPTGETLPKTGQLKWPIPVLTICGVAVFVAGCWLTFGGKKRHET